jgi:hypothetical protein
LVFLGLLLVDSNCVLPPSAAESSAHIPTEDRRVYSSGAGSGYIRFSEYLGVSRTLIFALCSRKPPTFWSGALVFLGLLPTSFQLGSVVQQRSPVRIPREYASSSLVSDERWYLHQR